MYTITFKIPWTSVVVGLAIKVRKKYNNSITACLASNYV